MKKEKIALLIDELEDIRCDNFNADTNEDKTLKEAIRVIKASKKEPKTQKVIKMREATPEERESIDKYIKSISKPTVVNFWNLEQKSSRDMEEIEEIINCDADAETKCKMISNILTAKPHYFEKQEPKIGHWIKYGIPRCEEQHYQCTNCGYYINFGKWGEFYTKEFKYCPNCRAKMTESENKLKE